MTNSKPLMLSAAEATGRFSHAMGVAHHLVGPLAGGETGATQVRDERGRSRVLKWESDPDLQVRRREAVALAEQLRTRATWPVPRQGVVDDGPWLFVHQQLMPGRPVECLTHSLVDELLMAHRDRLGLAPSSDATRWTENLRTTLTAGGQGYCRHEPLHDHDHRTRALIQRIEAIGRSLVPGDLPGGDIVHWDLHPGNLLADGGRLSAIIDLDFATTGDAAFDLVTLAAASLATAVEPGVRGRLFAAAFDELDDVRRGAYVGHLLIRFIDWPLRKGRQEEVELWLAHADRLLDGP